MDGETQLNDNHDFSDYENELNTLFLETYC
jgi:hypothetical protein